MESKLKVVIFAGGRGTRLSEKTNLIPKPMVEIGGIPMIVHLMSHFAHYGHTDFIILGGYKVDYIKEYFIGLRQRHSSVIIDYESNSINFINKKILNWKVTILDTGVDTLTGKRLSLAKEYVGEEFYLTYGDGLSDVNINDLYKHHKKTKAVCTLTSINPGSKYGQLSIANSDLVSDFTEKPKFHEWINGGFMVCNKEIFSYLPSHDEMLESSAFYKLVKDKKLSAFKHRGYWECVDSLRDLEKIEQSWVSGACPWFLPNYFN